MPEAKLVRRLGVVAATAIVVSNMIGTGIFTTTGFLAGDLGSPGLVIGIWVIGGVLALAGALCYVELALNFPRSGGEYVYLKEAWGPTWGFINGWVSLFAGFSAPIAAAALAISAYVGLGSEGRSIPLGPLTLPEYLTRNDDILTVVTMIDDPIFMDEPFVQSTTYEYDPSTVVIG